MAVYKFKISFEDYEDIFRVIEIKSTQTFLDLHKAILDSIGFDQKQMASFYMSNDSWKRFQEITLEDMTEQKITLIKAKIQVVKFRMMKPMSSDYLKMTKAKPVVKKIPFSKNYS
jgi:hypothetical protein